MKNLFDETYYERGKDAGISCYSNYRWLPELTIPLAAQLIIQLNIKPHHRILDFGCAKGYLVKAFRLLHYEAFGVDISEYAISNAPNDIVEYLSLIGPNDQIPTHYDWAIAKDVLEHVPYCNIRGTLKKLRNASDKLLVIVPLGKDGSYVIPEYDNDVTHQITEPMDWWKRELAESGFDILMSTYSMPHIKSNWSQWELGNAFILAE